MNRLLRPRLAFVLLALAGAACNGAPGHAAGGASEGVDGAQPAPPVVQPLHVPVSTWKDLVSAEAYRVLFERGTERAGTSPLNDEHSAGTFVCAACHLPLFSSGRKFDSGTGWPSFTAPIAGHVGLSEDSELALPRIEYHCVRCGAHQGHVFDDGPKPTGQRWCNNGVALRFVPDGQELPALRGERREGERTPDDEVRETAVFAGGCFWCMEVAFDGVEGVESAVSGYTGGHTVDPTYEEVNTHTTGHVEAVKVTFRPSTISYDRLLDLFWRNVDPTDGGGQFCDRGDTYASAIFAMDEMQRVLAKASLARAHAWLRDDEPIVTPIRAAGPFYDAEGYHQDYARKNPREYQTYRRGCQRDARLETLWGRAPEHPER